MNVLFIHSGSKPDYLNDAVLHGLKELYGKNVVESNLAWYLYDDISFWEKYRLWGRGFTLYGKLAKQFKATMSSKDINEKIRNHFFDRVIYGSVWRNLDHWDHVKEYYPPHKVIFIDGEDHTEINSELPSLGIYFKRELVSDNALLYPISFAVPEYLVLRGVPEKRKVFASLIPGDRTTYRFYFEKSYYRDYQQAIFGFTCKKGGWDCLRHYEILMNGCIPYFHDLASCPSGIMTNFPKSELINLDYNFLRHDYKELTGFLLNHTRNHLTTKKLAEGILGKSG